MEISTGPNGPNLAKLPSDPFWGLGQISVSSLPTNAYDSDQSTMDTVHRMIQLTIHSSTSPLITQVVKSCLSSPIYNATKDKLGLVRSIFWWVKGHVKFTEDETLVKQHLSKLGYTDEILNTPEGSIDLLISPEVLVSMPVPMGDCDDFSMLVASLLLASGFQKGSCRFVTIAADELEPMRFSHVYVKVAIGGGRDIALDASHGGFPGWETSKRFRVAEWEI